MIYCGAAVGEGYFIIWTIWGFHINYLLSW